MKYLKLIKEMTLEEKACLMSGKNFWETQDIKRLDIPSIHLSDGPNGLRKQAGNPDNLGMNGSLPATCFPTAVTLASSWNIDLIREVGEGLGEECIKQDVNVLLGPGTNVKRSPLCGRNFEYFSEDPFLNGKLASNYIKGVQSKGVGACLKHFAANSQEERRMTLDSVIDERTLREIYLTAFEIATKESLNDVIMSSYNLLNGTYTNENQHLLVDILRKEWGFKGVVVTDWGGDNDRVDGIKATNSLEMPGNNGDTDKEVIEAIKSGKLKEEDLDLCVDYILDLIFKTQKIAETKIDESIYETHRDLARKASLEGSVLLKNNGVLPLKKGTKVSLIGSFFKKPRYQGGGSSEVNPYHLENILEEIKNYDLDVVGYEDGFYREDKKSDSKITKAVELAKKSEVILLALGLDVSSEYEGLDRKNIDLAKNQLELLDKLIELNKKIVVVFSAGSAVLMNFDNSVDALLYTGLCGESGASATLDILTGKVNPSGKLIETIPLAYEDEPTSNYFPAKGIESYYKESIYVGYRYFDKKDIKVKYPFGYGLSYTKFEYSNLKIDEKGASFSIENTGDVEGKEVAELYIGLNLSKIFRCKKELKGFIKVQLKPKEKKEVFIPFDEYSFRYFNVLTNKFEIEGGEYDIYIGASLEDIRLKGKIKKEGTSTVDPYKGLKIDKYFTANIKDVSDQEFKELYGKELPSRRLNFYKKNRLIVDKNTIVIDLKYSRGFVGRMVARGIRMYHKLLVLLKKKGKANLIVMGVYNQPVRGISRMTNDKMNTAMLEGLILIFNGYICRGYKVYKEEKKKFKLEAKKDKLING